MTLEHEFSELYRTLRLISYSLDAIARDLKEMKTKQKVLICERCNIPKIERDVGILPTNDSGAICRDCVILIYS